MHAAAFRCATPGAMAQEMKRRADPARPAPPEEELITHPGIEMMDVRHSFNDLLVLDGIDLSIPPRSRVSFVGPSGCGKSTLLLMIAGLLKPQSGNITVGEAGEPSGRLRQCALMPQQDLLLPWRTAIDNACLALENRGISRAAARRKAQPLFEHFGLASFEHSYPSQLSGGMRQRVSFLRTLMADKAVFLLDEPFGALDAISRAAMQEWLLSAMAEVPKTIVLVTHDVEEALLLANTVVVFSSRPAKILDVIEVKLPARENRLEAVSDPEFVALKHRALGAIR
jgi:ABC-type nitrate/sulfonate/bicarbonate transport system ATPase subunit